MGQVGDAEHFLSRRAVDGLVHLTRELATSADLQVILDEICRAIVEVAEFEAVAFNLISDSGDLEVVAVAGPDGVDELLGTSGSREQWEREISLAKPHFGLLLMHSANLSELESSWINDDKAWFEQHRENPMAWTENHSLLALLSDTNGELIGAVSVDMPLSGLVPDAAQCATLEILARQAETAIVAAQKLASSELNEQMYRLAFESAPTMTAIAMDTGEFVDTNRAFAQAFGGTGNAAAFDQLVEVTDGVNGLQDALAVVFGGSGGWSTFVALHDGASGARWLNVTVRGIAHATTRPVRAVCTMVDITSERREQLRHRHDAEHDPLTGLLNRRGARLALESATALSPSDATIVVLAGDLDGFKAVNDRFGHQAGDHVLVEAGARMRQLVPPGSSVIRLGGDEFLIVTHCQVPEEAVELADDLVAVMRIPFDLEGRAVVVSMSVGVATQKACDVTEIGPLIDAADRALYEAKSAGRSQWIAASQVV